MGGGGRNVGGMCSEVVDERNSDGGRGWAFIGMCARVVGRNSDGGRDVGGMSLG